jgi:23S rRNA (adenine2503-C2)-methyltransferase
VNLLDLTPGDARATIVEWIETKGEPAYRARQIVPRLWQRPVTHWADATDLPAGLRNELDRTFPLSRPVRRAEQVSRDGTVKFLWEFPDKGPVESVMIPEGRRRTLCVSSQVGCAYGCVFCATGRMGFGRHLHAWEICAQVRELMLDARHGRPTSVVFMGMGEPLHNWDNVDRALTILNDPSGIGLGARHITVSTVGIAPGLRQLAARPEQFCVALSLHAATSEQRRQLMPVERKYPLAQILELLRQFPRRVTFEYVMIEGMNDNPTTDARALATVARSLGALVNLLPLHPGGETGYRPSSPASIEAFADAVQRGGVAVTIRRSRGLDISAACGQLRIELQQHSRVTSHVHGRIEE